MSDTPETDALMSDPTIERRDVPSRVWRKMAIIERQRDRLAEALRAMLVVMDRGPKPDKLDAALSWRQCDEKARSMADAALAELDTEKGK